VPRSFSLLRGALDVLLEATPRNVNVDTLREHEHSTFQLETEDRKRLESGTHP
jgi:hypothetical protein